MRCLRNSTARREISQYRRFQSQLQYHIYDLVSGGGAVYVASCKLKKFFLKMEPFGVYFDKICLNWAVYNLASCKLKKFFLKMEPFGVYFDKICLNWGLPSKNVYFKM